MKTKVNGNINEIIVDEARINRALKRGVREALLRHKLLGQSIVVWQDGRVVEIPPEKIPVGSSRVRKRRPPGRRVKARR